jgi:cbb3-type cytochrome oxidase subunit 3
MLTIETVGNIKKGSRITFFNGIYTIILGILYLVFLKTFLKMNFRSIEVIWQLFEKYNPALAALFIKMMVLKGIFVIAFGIIFIAFSMYILKKKDKNAWAVLFFIGIIFWASLLTLEILSKNWYTISASLFGWITFVIGMLLPIKYYMQRDYSEY